MAGSPLYVLKFAVRDLRVQVKLNDIEIFADRAGGAQTGMDPINPFIIEGKNRLEVRAGGVPVPRTAKDGPETKPGLRQGSAEFALLCGEFGQELGPEQRLLRYSFDPRRTPLTTPRLTTVMAADVPVSRAFGRWAWQDAPAFQEGDAGAVAQAVQGIYEALRTRDLARLEGLYRRKNEELARALDMTLEELEHEQTEHYHGLFDAPGYAVRFEDPAGLTCRAMAGGRLVSVTTARGEAPICIATSERLLRLSLMLGYVDDAWRPLR